MAALKLQQPATCRRFVGLKLRERMGVCGSDPLRLGVLKGNRGESAMFVGSGTFLIALQPSERKFDAVWKTGQLV